MAWLLGLADKAENILNKIDKNTAAALNKNKYDTLQPELTDVTWIPPQFGEIYREEGIAQLKMSDTSPRENITNSIMFSTMQSSSSVECPTDSTDKLDSASRATVRDDQSSPDFLLTSAETSNSTVRINEIDVQSTILYVENDTQRHENSAMNVQLMDTNTENASSTLEEGLDIVQEQYKSEISPQDMGALSQINLSGNIYAKRHLNDAEKRLEEKNLQLGKQATDHQKEIVVLNGKLQSLEGEKLQLSKQVVDLQSIVEKTRFELQSTRSELEQHRARALRTLQDKEKLIAELRSNESTGMDDATLMELNQLRQERDNLREEIQQIHKQLKVAREEQSNAEFALEKIRQKSTEANIQAQEIFATERQKRLVTEEDARVLSEEIKSLKDEVIHQRNNYTIQLQKQESEISRLRLQLSTASIPNSEIESRLAALTQTLVLKQQALESSTTERNALRLQLEKIEHEFRAALRASRRNVPYNNMNDTDDAKAQVPTFFMETPFDTGVTRRVKRVYSTLDAISVRTGVFLRRYPLARILVLIYMAILQLWVLVVLLSQSPEVH